MSLVLVTGGYAVEVQALTITGLTITYDAPSKTATVGPGPTYYPVNPGDLLILSDGSHAWETSLIRWGQGQAALDPDTGIVTLGAASGGTAGVTLLGTVIAFDPAATVTDLGSLGAEAAF